MDDFYQSSSSVGAPGKVRLYQGPAGAGRGGSGPACTGRGSDVGSDHRLDLSWDEQAASRDDDDESAAADSFYRAKLRESFIDVSNSYQQPRRVHQRPAPQQPPQPTAQPRGRDAGRTGSNAQGPSHHTKQDGLMRHHTVSHHPTSAGPVYGSSVRDYGYDSSTMSSKESSDSCGSAPYPAVSNGGHGGRIYRSASDLQLDRDDAAAHSCSIDGPALRKEYSSADTLEPSVATRPASGAADNSFFAMLRAYYPGNVDQRAPPPPDIHRVLRGRPELPASGQHVQTVTGSTASLENIAPTHNDLDTGSATPGLRASRKPVASRTKSASELTAGLVRRFRGGRSTADAGPSNGAGGDTSSRSSENSATGDMDMLFNVEEKVRRKAFVHFDCQSIGISFVELARGREARRPANTTTGASAASTRSPSATGLGSGTLDDAAGVNDEVSDPGDQHGNALLESCPYFRNELGGEEQREVALTRVTGGSRASTLLQQQGHFISSISEMPRPPICNGMSLLDLSASENEALQPDSLLRHRGYVLEYIDRGAHYYRRFFRSFEHQNYFGMDDNLGPVAISIRRDKGPDGKSPALHRVVIRTSELCVMRGAIVEDVVPTSSSRSSSRSVHAKDVLEYICPDLQLSCLRLAMSDDKTRDQLMKLDEQGVNEAFKVGILYCKSGQSTEEDMYNNQHGGPLLEEFLNLLGTRARLLGFKGYRGGLDNTDDTTGTHSVYASCCEGAATNGGPIEIMFHVSTLLPFTVNNRQQLLRKRHIGNDIVTIVFQEPGAPPFSPRVVRSHFQHVFIVVRAHVATPPGGGNGVGDASGTAMAVRYSVAVSRSKDVPPFGPPVPAGATFHKPTDLADFLLAKVINAENATHRSEKFVAMAVRTRREYLKDLAVNYVTSTQLDNISMLGRLAMSVGSGKKKEKKPRGGTGVLGLDITCAVVWTVQLEDYTLCSLVDAYLAISSNMVTVIEMDSRDVVFATPCSSVIGWTSSTNRLCLYYNHGECVAVKVAPHDSEDVLEIVSRLSRVTRGCETLEMVLRRNSEGQLGFNVHYEGVVSDVEPQGAAWRAGLISGSRLVEICKVVTATQTHDQVIDLLRTSEPVKVLVIPPLRTGEPREASEEKPSRRLLGNYAATDQDGMEVTPSVRRVQVGRTSSSSSGSSPHATLTTGSHAVAEPSIALHSPDVSYHSRSDSRDSNSSQRRTVLDISPQRNSSPALSSSLSSASFYTEYSAERQRNRMRAAPPPPSSSAAPVLSLPQQQQQQQHERSSSADMTVASAEDKLSRTMPESILRQHMRGGASRTSAASSAGTTSNEAQQVLRRRGARDMPAYGDQRSVPAAPGQPVSFGNEDSNSIYQSPLIRAVASSNLVNFTPEILSSSSGTNDKRSATVSTESILLPSVGPVSLLPSTIDGSAANGGAVNPRHSTIVTSVLRSAAAVQAGESSGRLPATSLIRSPSYENLVAPPYVADSGVSSGVVSHGGYTILDDTSWRPPRPAPRLEDPSPSNIDTEWSALVDVATRAFDGRANSFDAPRVSSSPRSMSPSKRASGVPATATDLCDPHVQAPGAVLCKTMMQGTVYQQPQRGAHPPAGPSYEDTSHVSAAAAPDLRAEQDRIAALERSIRQLQLDNERLRADNERLLHADQGRAYSSAATAAAAAGQIYAVSTVSQPPSAPAARAQRHQH